MFYQEEAKMNGVSNGAIGTLNEDQFYFSQLEPCDNCELNPLPKTIELSGYNPNWNKNFSMILKRVTSDRAFIRLLIPYT